MTKLTRSPRLVPHLAKGALNSPRKRAPFDDARLPSAPLTLEAAKVDPGRLSAYNATCRFPAGRGTLPPTYPHIMAFPLAMRLMAAADFPFPLLGLIHTGITLTCPTPLPVTARPTLTVHTEDLQDHRKGSEFAVVTTAALDGATVWHSRSTYLCKHPTPARKPHSPDEAPQEERTPLPSHTTWELPAHLGRRYATASGDRNPIHLHPLTARLFGFPHPIAHGMWTFARCLAELNTADDITAAQATFKAPVPLPTAVTFATGEPTPAALVPFTLRSDDARGGGSRTHLSGHVERASSADPASGSPAPPSRSS